MNGAELWDGVVLQVQPASTSDQDMLHMSAASTVLEKMEENGKAAHPACASGDDDDELDEFFDSL